MPAAETPIAFQSLVATVVRIFTYASRTSRPAMDPSLPAVLRLSVASAATVTCCLAEILFHREPFHQDRRLIGDNVDMLVH